jgi:hypothetical protein
MTFDEGAGLIRADFDRDDPDAPLGYLDEIRVTAQTTYPVFYNPSPGPLDQTPFAITCLDAEGHVVAELRVEKTERRERLVMQWSDGSTKVLARKRWWQR